MTTAENARHRPGPRRFEQAIMITSAVAFAGALVFTAAASAEADDNTGQRLQAAFDAVIADDATIFPGTVVHIRRGTETWSLASGLADTGTGAPALPDSRFRAGSIMKPFISTVVLQLVEAGQVALDAPITAYLAEPITARFASSDRITVRMLLNHTSGLAEWHTEAMMAEGAADPLRVYTDAEILDIAAAQPAWFAPGEGWAYSNTNYNLLGAIIDAVTGASWRDAIRTRIIEPLGLANTTLPEPGSPFVAEPVMHAYHYFHGGVYDLTAFDPSIAGAAGGGALVTTTADLATFLDALRSGALFAHPETLALMETWVAADEEQFQDGYGLGLQHFVLPGGLEMLGHLGGAGGYLSLVAYLPALDVTLALSINGWPGDPGPLLWSALQILGAPTG